MPEIAIECIDDDVVHAYRAGVARDDWWRLWKLTRRAVRPAEPACWEIRRDHRGVARRVRLWGRKDFSGAHGRGRRGVMMWFSVADGREYLLQRPLPGGRVEFQYIRIRNGSVQEVPCPNDR